MQQSLERMITSTFFSFALHNEARELGTTLQCAEHKISELYQSGRIECSMREMLYGRLSRYALSFPMPIVYAMALEPRVWRGPDPGCGLRSRLL
jgi:hypothetical protein